MCWTSFYQRCTTSLTTLTKLYRLLRVEDGKTDGLFQALELALEELRFIRLFSQNFMIKPNRYIEFAKINVDDESKWISFNEVYPGFAAAETLANMRPHEKESFLIHYRNWYKAAIRQMQKRIDLPRPILEAFVDVDHVAIVKGQADVKSGGVLTSKVPNRLSQCCGVQTIDRQWCSLLVDEDVKKGAGKPDRHMISGKPRQT